MRGRQWEGGLVREERSPEEVEDEGGGGGPLTTTVTEAFDVCTEPAEVVAEFGPVAGAERISGRDECGDGVGPDSGALWELGRRYRCVVGRNLSAASGRDCLGEARLSSDSRFCPGG